MGIALQGYRRAVAASLLAAAVLAGCSSTPENAGPNPDCPVMSVLSDAASVRYFRDGPGRTPDDVTYDVEVLDAKLDCDGVSGGQVTAEVGLSIYVRKGLAGKDLTEVSIPYFVTITETNTRVISRAVYTTQVAFGKGENANGIIEHLTITVPLEGKSPTAFEVIGGIQLTEAQFIEERRRRAQ